MQQYPNIDAYINDQTADKQRMLKQLRKTIARVVPHATEKISYGMPCFHQYANLVYFAAMKQHIGFYPSSSGVSAFKDRLTAYKTSKGAIQFPLNQPLPLSLIAEMTKFRLKEEEQKAMAKQKPTICRKGHSFYKRSGCLVCPVCEQENKPADGWMKGIAAPARRALEHAGIKTERELSKHSLEEVMALHGMGKASIPLLEKALAAKGLSFRKRKPGGKA